jgi:hypothetical protein
MKSIEEILVNFFDDDIGVEIVLANMLTTAEFLDDLDEPTDAELLEIEKAQELIT